MRILAFFQTLRGKLILTYTLVTVLALLALEVLGLLFAVTLAPGTYTDTLQYLDDVIAVLPPQARAYVLPESRDLPGLQAWLQTTYDHGYASLPPEGLLDAPAASIRKGSAMYVIGPDRTILAAVPDSAKALVGGKYSPPAGVARGEDVLANAMRASLDPGQVSALQPDGSYWMAVPVEQNQREGPVVAVVLVNVQAPPIGARQWWPHVLAIVLVTAVLLLGAVAPFGAVFGFIMSRGLTRRLQALSRSADAWSAGDFSLQPQDRSGDEIGHLGTSLRHMAENIQALMHTRQELTLMEERNRLARELHDTVKQESFATLMQVRAAKNLLERDPAAAREHLDAAEDLIKSSQQELGLIITELRPAAVQGQGLASALQTYLEGWSQLACIPADLQVQGQQRLPLETEQALFRVAQEALSNVARHSRASAVTLRLAFDPTQVTLSVADNGVGFDPSAAASGIGLQSMRERLAAIHGQLNITAAPEGGATITAAAPTTNREGTR